MRPCHGDQCLGAAGHTPRQLPTTPTGYAMNTTSELFEQVYDRLHLLAQRQFHRQPASSTLQPTALIHEVWVRFARAPACEFQDREHFLAVATTAMRQILVDRARRRKSSKRGGDQERLTLTDAFAVTDHPHMDVLVVDELLTRLAALSPRQARTVELRVFAGMTVTEVATVLCVSVATVEKDWRRARAWMRVELGRHSLQ